MQSGHGGNSQAEGDAEESEPDEKFSCHSQPTILWKEMSAVALSWAADVDRRADTGRSRPHFPVLDWCLHFQFGVVFWRVILREVYFEGPYRVWRTLMTSIWSTDCNGGQAWWVSYPIYPIWCRWVNSLSRLHQILTWRTPSCSDHGLSHEIAGEL